MYPVSANFHTLAIQDAPKTRVRIYFIGDAVDCTDDNAVQTNGTLLIGKAGDTDSNGRIGQNGITFSEFFNPDKNIQVGAAVSSQIGMTLLNTDGALDNFQYGRCKVYLDVYDTANSSWLTCPMGVYIIDLPTKRKVQLVNATGYDQMQKLDEICDTWWSALNWSGGITLSQLLTSLATQIGVSVSSNTASAIVNGSVSFTEEPFQCIEVTYREVLEYIAEATGTVARFDRNGALDLRWFAAAQISGNTVTVNTDTVGNQCLEISVAEYSVAAVDLLKVKLYTDDIGTTVGTGTNQYTIVNNLFLDGANSSAIIAKATPIYNRLHGLGAYSPVSARIITDWSIEAGDIINIVNGGTTYSVPIFQQSMAWRGGYVVSDLLSDGDNVRPVLDYDERTYYRLNSEMSKKVGDDEIISKINQSPESITIQASKLNLNGYVTVTDLSTSGATVINGSNVTVGGEGNSRGIITIYPQWSNPGTRIGQLSASQLKLYSDNTFSDTVTTKNYYIEDLVGYGEYSVTFEDKSTGILAKILELGSFYTDAEHPYGRFVLSRYLGSGYAVLVPESASFSLNGYTASIEAGTNSSSTLKLLTDKSVTIDGTTRKEGIYLDTNGSTFDSVIDVTPRRCYATLSSQGWYRAIKFSAINAYDLLGADGSIIDIYLSRIYNITDNEAHKISLLRTYNNNKFVSESSVSNSLGIDKIRLTVHDGGSGDRYAYIDIHYSLTTENPVAVHFNVYSAKFAVGNDYTDKWSAENMTSMGTNDPPNETVLTEYTFITTSGEKNTFTPSHGTSAFGGCWYSRSGEYVTVHVGLTGITANTNHRIGTLPVGYRPVSQCCSAGSSATYEQSAHLYVRENGDIDIWSPNTMASLDSTFMWR